MELLECEVLYLLSVPLTTHINVEMRNNMNYFPNFGRFEKTISKK